MTEFAVTRAGSTIIVGPPRPHPERAAIVEARGALLLWDELDRRPQPAAEIHDPELAADWLWDLYGHEAAHAILNGANRIEVETVSSVLDAARELAHLRWAEAWWPSSYAAVVPALSRGLLRAEAAWRTSAVEHLLEDEEAVERALAAVDLGPLVALEDHPLLGAEARELATDLAELSEGYGIELARAEVPSRPEDWTLAAGGSRADDLVMAGGHAPVAWANVPQGLVDSAAEATWALARREGGQVLMVAVAAAPDAYDTALTARIGSTDIELHHDPAIGTYTGEAEAPQGFVMLPAARRSLSIFAPGFATGPGAADPDADSRSDALIDFARERLTAPDACLAERAAAR